MTGHLRLTVVLAVLWGGLPPIAASAQTTAEPAQAQVTAQAAPRPAAPEPSEVIRYGEAPSQIIEVYRPSGSGPHPVVVFIHGGCYVSTNASIRSARRLGTELAQRGVIVWNVGYRRTDEAGGTFPALFNDIGTATDRLRAEAERLGADMSRVVFAGHSSGGHLALWSAGRANIAADSPLHVSDPVRPVAVVGISGPGQFEGMQPLLDGTCGAETFVRLMGASTAGRPDVLADTSPDRLLPFGVPVHLIVGSQDDVVPPAFVEAFARVATSAGDTVDAVVIEGADHIDPVDVRTDAWPRVRSVILTAAGL